MEIAIVAAAVAAIAAVLMTLAGTQSAVVRHLAHESYAASWSWPTSFADGSESLLRPRRHLSLLLHHQCSRLLPASHHPSSSSASYRRASKRYRRSRQVDGERCKPCMVAIRRIWICAIDKRDRLLSLVVLVILFQGDCYRCYESLPM